MHTVSRIAYNEVIDLKLQTSIWKNIQNKLKSVQYDDIYVKFKNKWNE